jgi:hypothetical protein
MRDDESTIRTRCFADLADPVAITTPPYRRGSDRIVDTEWVVESREHRIAPPERSAVWIVRWREMRWRDFSGDAGAPSATLITH